MAEDGGIAGIGEAFRDLQRVGPDLMLVASEMAVTSPGGVGAGAFYIDPERAQECITALRRVDFDLGEAASMASRARLVDPPGSDGVSRNVAVQAQLMSDRSFAYVEAWRTQIKATVDALEMQSEAYRRVDADGSGRT